MLRFKMSTKIDLKKFESSDLEELAKDIASSMFPEKKISEIVDSRGFAIGGIEGYGPNVVFNHDIKEISVSYHLDGIGPEFNTRGDAFRLVSAYKPYFKTIGYGFSLVNEEGFDL